MQLHLSPPERPYTNMHTALRGEEPSRQLLEDARGTGDFAIVLSTFGCVYVQGAVCVSDDFSSLRSSAGKYTALDCTDQPGGV